MRADRVLVALQSLVALAAVGLVTVFVAHGLPAGSITTVLLAIGFGVALLTLGFFNVWLPRGDAVDTTVPVAFAAGIMLHPIFAVGVVLLSRCATVALRPRGHTLTTAVEQVGRRAVLISVMYAVLGPKMILSLQSGESIQRLGIVTAAAIAFIALDALLEQAHASIRFGAPLRALVVGAVRLQGWMLAAEMSAAVLAVVLLRPLQFWGLLVTVALLLVMRQSFALLLEVRASYTSTVEVLARSLEAYDPDRRGHAERVARMCGQGGRVIGLQGKRLESLTYAALFHDVGRLGSDNLDEQPEHPSAEVLANVGFLAGAVPVLHILDTAGEGDESFDESDLISAYFVAVFSSFDNERSAAHSGSDELAAAIGARLYSSTRSAVDRVVERVQREARAGSLPDQELADVIT
jgi:hypothetical protein